MSPWETLINMEIDKIDYIYPSPNCPIFFCFLACHDDGIFLNAIITRGPDSYGSHVGGFCGNI